MGRGNENLHTLLVYKKLDHIGENRWILWLWNKLAEESVVDFWWKFCRRIYFVPKFQERTDLLEFGASRCEGDSISHVSGHQIQATSVPSWLEQTLKKRKEYKMKFLKICLRVLGLPSTCNYRKVYLHFTGAS